MLGDLILSLVQALTTLWRWVRPLPEINEHDRAVALPALHFVSTDTPPTPQERYDAWFARFVARVDPLTHDMLAVEGQKILDRFWGFEPIVQRRSPSHQPFKDVPYSSQYVQLLAEADATRMRDEYRRQHPGLQAYREGRQALIEALYPGQRQEVKRPHLSLVRKKDSP
jgi:hypothetical protein